MFRADLLPIIRSLDTVFTAIGICHTIYVDCLPYNLQFSSQIDGTSIFIGSICYCDVTFLYLLRMICNLRVV